MNLSQSGLVAVILLIDNILVMKASQHNIILILHYKLSEQILKNIILPIILHKFFILTCVLAITEDTSKVLSSLLLLMIFSVMLSIIFIPFF